MDSRKNLHRLLYISRATRPLDEGELEKLEAQAATNNKRRGVTGILLHASGYFLQVLEGNLVELKVLYEKISRDSRHENIHLLLFTRATSRVFPSWHFGAFSLDREQQLEFEGLEEIIRCFDRASLDQLDQSLVMSLIAEFRAQLLPDEEPA